MSKPEELRGMRILDDNRYAPSCSENEIVSIDPEKGLILIDDSKVWHGINPKELLEQIGKNRLMEQVESLIEQVKNDEKQS